MSLSDSIGAVPEAHLPVIDAHQVNDDLVLHRGKMSLAVGGQSAEVDGEVRLAWLPVPEVRFSGTPTEDLHLSPGKGTLAVAGWIGETECFMTDASFGTDRSPSVRGILGQAAIVGEPDVRTSELHFVLSNFHDFIGEPIRPQGSTTEFRRARRSHRFGEWRVVLDGVKDWKHRKLDLRERGGFAVSHAGLLTREDSADFSPSEATEALDALHFWLAFQRGFWVGPMFATADPGSPPAWQKVGAPILSTWSNRPSWYPRRTSIDLDAAGTSFFSRWQDSEWKTPLQHTVWWYVEANAAATPETSLIMSQAALELLGWAILVETDGAVSPVGFDRLPASDKIRILLGHLGIPLYIPSDFADLESFGKGENAHDGPQVVSSMRNAIMHPSIKKRAQMARANVEAKWQARELALSYVELSLLSFLGYSGAYRDRTARSLSAVEIPVPWQARS